MPCSIFEIDELVRLVIEQLVASSRRTAVSLALTCRSLEEPSLSSLWKQQKSLLVLIKVLPDHIWEVDENTFESIVSICDFPAGRIQFKSLQALKREPSAEDWTRLRRYASWMRELHLLSFENIASDTISQFLRNSPGGVLCPKLDYLSWDVRGVDIVPEFFQLFLSPNLKRADLCAGLNIPLGQLELLVQIISCLPTSLEELFFICGREEESLQDAISSFVCRCGPSLRRFSTCTRLSGTAARHLMELPNLHYWHTRHGLPTTIPTPTRIFPLLEEVTLGRPEALPWVHFLALHGRDITRNGFPTTSHKNVGETLKCLNFPSGTIIESTLLSSIINFRNLVELCANIYCSTEESCRFHLTDGDMENLAAALPRLERLELGRPCRFNSCGATVTSLLSISIHCLGLKHLETHFNTLNVVDDIHHLLNEGAGRGKAKCKITGLPVGDMETGMREEDIKAVAVGLKVIFPCLRGLEGKDGGLWFMNRWIVE